MGALTALLVSLIVVVGVALLLWVIIERFSPDPLITKIVQAVVVDLRALKEWSDKATESINTLVDRLDAVEKELEAIGRAKHETAFGRSRTGRD